MKKLLAPSLLSADFGKLTEQIEQVRRGGADLLHLDIMDGHFVPDITYGPPVIRSLAKSSSLPFDIHLMIEQPDQLIPHFITERTEMLTVHAEAAIHLQRTLRLIRSFNVKAGVALNPATPLSVLDYIWEDLDLILLMSVNPGYAGQSFIPSAQRKLVELVELKKRWKPDLIIAMDGGLDVERSGQLCQCGLDMVIAGSAIFAAEDLTARCLEFRHVIDAAI
jgi:ribulose-phosphate 3-epimerase